MKLECALMLSLALFTQYCEGAPPERQSQSVKSAQKEAPTYNQNSIDLSIQKLKSEESLDREQARAEIKEAAEKSPEDRIYIVRKLIELVDVPEARNIASMPDEVFEPWSVATGLLGELKATEAIDVLIASIFCNNGKVSLSTSRFPAARSLVEIGEPAVPKLAEALQSKTPNTRYMAAITLGEIHSVNAKEILIQALPTEKDEEIANTMKAILRSWV